MATVPRRSAKIHNIFSWQSFPSARLQSIETIKKFTYLTVPNKIGPETEAVMSSVKKVFLKIFAKFKGKHLRQSFFLKKSNRPQTRLRRRSFFL